MPRKSYPLKLNFDIYYRKSDEKWCEYREISKALKVAAGKGSV